MHPSASASSATRSISSSSSAGNGNDLAAAEVDQPSAHAVTLGAPAVLGDQEVVVAPPALVRATEPPEHPCDALGRGRQRHGVVQARRDVADPRLQRREAVGGADVPPDLGGVLDHPDIDEGRDGAFVYPPSFRMRGGRPVRGRLSKTEEAVAARPVSMPCQNGEEVESASRCGTKTRPSGSEGPRAGCRRSGPRGACMPQDQHPPQPRRQDPGAVWL